MNDGGADPAGWSQFYHHATSIHRIRPLQSLIDTSVISTVVTTMPISIDAATASGSWNTNGHGSKPPRKRSRTSRRAPTTLLNTDTSNFRAMVQQFTGAPSVPYSTTYVPDEATTLNFSNGFENPVSRASVQPSVGILETRQQKQQQQRYQKYMMPQQYPRLPPQQQSMFDFAAGGNMEDDLLQELENSREVGLGFPEGYFLDGIDGRVNPSRQPSDNNQDGGYFL